MGEVTQLAAAMTGLGLAILALSWVWRASARATIIEQLERSIALSQSRQDSQEAEMSDLRGQIHELREGQLAGQMLLQEWITYARRLGQLLREATGQEPPPEPRQWTVSPTPVDLARLARTIQDRFSIEEMNNLAFDLGLDGTISGDTVAARAMSLVSAARRRGMLGRLVERCRQERPDGGF